MNIFQHYGLYYLSSRGCITLGYLIHHTLIAVFFWMSAMSIHVTRTMLNSFNENKSKNPNRMILVNMVYAQGFPFLITIVTLIMDATVKKQFSQINISFFLPGESKNQHTSSNWEIQLLAGL